MENEKLKCTNGPKVDKNSLLLHFCFYLLWQYGRWFFIYMDIFKFRCVFYRVIHRCCSVTLFLSIIFRWKLWNLLLSDRASRRKLEKRDSLINKQPTSAEQTLIHDIFIRTVDTTDPLLGRRILPPGCIWLEDATLISNIFSHPEVYYLQKKYIWSIWM